MSDSSEKFLFQPSAMVAAPDGPGVFELLSGTQTILIDWSDVDVRAKLREHHAGKHGTCTQIATHFRYIGNDSPQDKFQQMVDDHVKKVGKAPRCNK